MSSKVSYKKLENKIIELQTRADFFQLIADNTFDLQILMDAAGKIIYSNSVFKKITGYAVKEILTGKVIEKEIVHPDDWNSYRLKHDKIKQQLPVVDFEFRIIRKDVSERTVNLCSQPIYKNKEYKGAIISIRDITDFKNYIEIKQAKEKIEKSEKLYRTLIETSPDIIVLTDLTGKHIYKNDSYYKSLGYNVDDKVNLDGMSRVHPDDMDYVKDAMVELMKKGIGIGEYRVLHKDGRWIYRETKAKIITDEKNEPYQILSIMRDVTNRKKFEEELLISKEKAEESDRLKTAFLHNMSHEIRTPMNAIMGFSDLMVKNLDNRTKLQKFSTIINQRCDDLLSIIDDLLNIAKIESGQLQLNISACNIGELCNELLDIFREYQTRMGKQHIKFILSNNCSDLEYVILTDSGKLKQIIINLITNAFKYTKEGTINCWFEVENKNKLFFKITDTGIGIPEDKQSYIFERFSQLNDNTEETIGGTGLGLSIVRGLVNLLGGEINMESKLSKGSSFTIKIPFKTKPLLNEVPIGPINYENKDISGKTILVVEDDPYNAAYIQEVLRETGMRVILAENGKEAVDISLTQPLDLIFMDIRLPGMNGYDATHIIKQQKPELKIIAQTAYASNEEQQKALDAGCNGYISKPLKHDALTQIVKKYLAD